MKMTAFNQRGYSADFIHAKTTCVEIARSKNYTSDDVAFYLRSLVSTWVIMPTDAGIIWNELYPATDNPFPLTAAYRMAVNLAKKAAR
jgi:hypothetical protein